MRFAMKFLDMNFNDDKYKDVFTGDSDLKTKTKNDLSREGKLVLYYVYKHSKANMGEISSAFTLPNSTTNYIVKKLEADNFVIVRKLKDDNRIREVVITEDGIDKIEKMLYFLNTSLKGIFTVLFSDLKEEISEELTDEEIKVVDKFYKLGIEKLTITKKE